MSLRWNGAIIENPRPLRRPHGWQAVNLQLEHSAIPLAYACIAFGGIAGRLTAPFLGY